MKKLILPISGAGQLQESHVHLLSVSGRKLGCVDLANDSLEAPDLAHPSFGTRFGHCVWSACLVSMFGHQVFFSDLPCLSPPRLNPSCVRIATRRDFYP